jgi:hypothetical protein
MEVSTTPYGGDSAPPTILMYTRPPSTPLYRSVDIPSTRRQNTTNLTTRSNHDRPIYGCSGLTLIRRLSTPILGCRQGNGVVATLPGCFWKSRHAAIVCLAGRAVKFDETCPQNRQMSGDLWLGTQNPHAEGVRAPARRRPSEGSSGPRPKPFARSTRDRKASRTK